MKKHFLVLMICICAIISYSRAQTGKESSAIPLLNEGESICKRLNENSNVRRFEIDLVNQSSNKLTLIKLNSIHTYSIMLVGELNIINEIELEIYTYLNRSLVFKSDIKNPTRRLETTFKPDKTDYYEFEIIAKKFSVENKVGRYCLIIAY